MKLPDNVPVQAYAAEALVPLTPEVKDLLTLTNKFGEPYTLYRHEFEGSPKVFVPRGLVNKSKGPDYTVANPVPNTQAIKPPQTEEQGKVIAESLELLQSGVDHVVEAPTGFGKTYVGCSVAGKLGQKTLIVVTKNDLIKGWKDTLVHLFGVNPSEIGHVQQDTAKFHNCRFVVAMVHSLICRDYDPSLYQSFGLVIFDEVHRLGADYFAQVCSRFPSRHRLGLSATPTRSDGKEKLFQAHIGPVMVRGSWVPMSPKIIVKQTGWKVPIVPQRGDDGTWKKMPMKLVPGRMMPVTKAIAADFTRNKEIAHFVKSAYDAGRHVLVMSDLIEDHLQPLFHMIVAEGIPGNDVAYYHGQVKKEQLEVAKTKRVVLATYLMCGEGTNVPHWDTLVLATPRSNVKQAVGRVLRKVEGKKQPVVLDLVDNHEILKTFYFSRLKQYYSVGAEIVQV